MMHYYGSMGSFGFGWLFQLLIFAAFFLIVWWLIKGSPGIRSNESAKDILQKRLAKGEITVKQYENLKKMIE